MKVMTVVDSLSSQSSGDTLHQAKVYPAIDNPGEPMMVKGWNSNASAARQHASQWARMHGHEIKAGIDPNQP